MAMIKLVDTEHKSRSEVITQKFDGVVVEVHQHHFVVRIKDEVYGDELFEKIEKKSVEKQDLEVFEVGAQFTYYHGYEYSPGGNIWFDRIKFKHLPPWTEADLERAKEQTSGILK